MRILVTGSRDWDDDSVISEALRFAQLWVDPNDTGVTLVSGACPTGADRMAEEFARRWGWTIERHPAEWNKHGGCWCRDHSKRCGFAGPRRNKEMVDSKPDICVGFVKNNSRGATGTLKLAEEAGITTWRYDSE